MELNREQVINALECCTSSDKSAECPIGCPFGDINSCEESLMYHALTLIRELTEENERLREDNEIKSQKRANIFEILSSFERGRADGVRKMQERFNRIFGGMDATSILLRKTFDQIAKEILEEKQ